MGRKYISRRDLLKTGIAAGVSSLISGCGAINKAASTVSGGGTPASTCAKLTDVEHVVILIQENRSFDHYFGTYKGARGFSESSNAYKQPYPGNTAAAPSGLLYPFHLDTSKWNAACTHDIDHGWIAQHQSWNNGANDGFVTSHIPINANDAVLTMGYYTRADLPYYYAVADAFTLCDNYYCSVIGPTHPNRLYTMAASIDPDGKNGGPLIQTLVTNRSSMYGKLTYTTMPEQLQSRGISWKIYSSSDSSIGNGVLSSDNVLPFFKNFQDPTTTLYKNAFGPQFPTDFVADAASGNLPQVSWIIPSVVESDHPPSPSLLGELTLASIINTLTANPAQWAKTVLFVTYDENGGFFDHVAPPTASPGTPGEYITATPIPDSSVLGGITGPIGLGFRVPMLIISPFARDGFISSDTFDHTSVLRFLETRFGAEVPNLSAWRRATVGDMTSAFNFSKPDTSVPVLPTLNAADTTLINGCISALTGTTPYPIPNPQTLPAQEQGAPIRPNSSC
jgi:phospholipase C